MMNIDKPKFFINELAYQDSIDNLHSGVLGIGQGDGAGNNVNLIETPVPIYNHPEKRFDPEAAYGFPPIIEIDAYLVFSLKEGYWSELFLNEEDELSQDLPNSKYGTYFSILGHTIDVNNYNSYWLGCSALPFNEIAGLELSVAAFDTAFSKLSLAPVFNANQTNEEGVYTATKGGWSMCRGLKSDFLLADAKTLIFKLPSTRHVGSLAIGNYTTLPYNPNSNYTFDLVQDGIKYKTAKGGSSFSYSNYIGPPRWVGGGSPWEVGYNDFSGGGIEFMDAPKKPRLGRRSYDMTWEGFADTDIMPTNTLSTSYDDTNAGDANDTILDGNTLYNQILIKTLNNSFIFQHNSTTIDPQNFMIGRWGSPHMSFSQLSHKIYGFSNSIVESW